MLSIGFVRVFRLTFIAIGVNSHDKVGQEATYIWYLLYITTKPHRILFEMEKFPTLVEHQMEIEELREKNSKKQIQIGIVYIQHKHLSHLLLIQ